MPFDTFLGNRKFCVEKSFNTLFYYDPWSVSDQIWSWPAWGNRSTSGGLRVSWQGWLRKSSQLRTSSGKPGSFSNNLANLAPSHGPPRPWGRSKTIWARYNPLPLFEMRIFLSKLMEFCVAWSSWVKAGELRILDFLSEFKSYHPCCEKHGSTQNNLIWPEFWKTSRHRRPLPKGALLPEVSQHLHTWTQESLQQVRPPKLYFFLERVPFTQSIICLK